MPLETPPRPGQRIGVKRFTFNNKEFLITVDYFSNFWEKDKLNNTLASIVILRLKSHFVRYGCPDQVVSDNGPQFEYQQFQKFAETWDFKHTPSSPSNSKANGKAESAVKTVKSLLCKALNSSKDPYMAILDYRNTPTQGMDSIPVQRLMNRGMKTLLPTSRTLLQPRVIYPEKDQRNLAKRQEQQVRYFNQGTRDLREVGDVVRIKPFRLGDKVWKKATMAARLDERSYSVEITDGSVSCRTRCHLRKTPEKAESALSDDSKSAEKGVRSPGEQITPSEPAFSSPTCKEAKQQEQSGKTT